MKKIKLLSFLGIAFAMGLTACGGEASSQNVTSSAQESSITSNADSSSAAQASSSASSAQQSSAAQASSTASHSSSAQASSASSAAHVHSYGNLVEEVLPSYAYDGMKAHYYCADCGQYFDTNKNPVTEESLKLPKAGESIAVSVNGVQKGVFTKVEQEQFVTFAEWEYKGLVVAVGDVITLTKPGDSTYKYQCFGDGNVDKDGKVLTAGTVNLSLHGNANGFHLEVSGYKYPGLVVKVNDSEYPLNKVTYYEDNKETYIYGYHYFNVGDKMTVVDNVNNVTYDYEDLENDVAWNVFDFHKGTNNEIVFDYQARFGIEFDRGGDKKISITKTFGPNDGTAFEVAFNSERASNSLKEYTFEATSEEYESIMWYISHEKVTNNSDIVEYVQTKGLKAYMATINFEANEQFNIHNITTNTYVKGDHLVSIYGETTDYATISGDYLKITKAGSYLVEYVPSCDAIALFSAESVISADGYLMQGSNFIQGTLDASGLVVYNNVYVPKNGYVVFLSSNYDMLTVTLDSSCDSTLVRFSSFMVYLNKAGTFNFKINMSTNVIFIEVVELDPEDQPVELTAARLIGAGGLSGRLTENPDNTNEICIKNITVTGATDPASPFYITFYYDDFSAAIEGVTLDADSTQYATNYSTLFYIKSDGTYDFYLNKTSLVLRIVKH